MLEDEKKVALIGSVVLSGYICLGVGVPCHVWTAAIFVVVGRCRLRPLPNQFGQRLLKIVWQKPVMFLNVPIG